MNLDELATQVVDTVQAAGGTFPGKRALHAKGTSAVGTFVSSGAAAALTTAPHLQAGAELVATLRFSNGGGDPHSRDDEVGGRGMAVKLKHADGSGRFDLVGLSLPAFTVADPETFVEFLHARADNDALMAFIGDHPETARVLGIAMSAGLPESFATVQFNGIHTFVLVAADGTRRPYRYHWTPEAGIESLPPDADPPGADYLSAEPPARLAREPVRFRLDLQLANAGDPLDDPSAIWEGEHEHVAAGTLTITALHTDPDAADALIYDPTHVPDGIECSDDPILAFRPKVYGVSYDRRTSS